MKPKTAITGAEEPAGTTVGQADSALLREHLTPLTSLHRDLIAALPADEDVGKVLDEERGGMALRVFSRWREAGFSEERAFLAALRHLAADLAQPVASGRPPTEQPPA